ncbi:MAG: DoxX family membrane protein [Bacteroidota bacterium]
MNWGNWDNFSAYTQTLTHASTPFLTQVFAVTATVLEALFAVLLLAGFKTRYAAVASGVLLTFFALAMLTAVGLKPTLDYSVWVGAAGCFLLAQNNDYKYSIDNFLNK